MKRVFIIIVSALVVVSVFVSLKYYTFGRVLPKANFGMRAICATENISDLYIGSSMFRQGIDASQLDDNAYLLAYNSNKPCHEVMQLKNILENGAKFQRLIVDMYPYSLVREAELSDVRMIMDGNMRFTFDLFASLQSNHSLSLLYDMLVLQNNELFLTFPISYKLINSRNKRGSNTSINHGKTAEKLGASERASETEIAIQFKDVQLSGLYEIIDLSSKYGFDLLFLETPKYKNTNMDEVYQNLMVDYAKILSEKGVHMILSDQTKEIVCGDVDQSLVRTYSFEDENPLYFTDNYHISYEGRQQFSAELKQLL